MRSVCTQTVMKQMESLRSWALHWTHNFGCQDSKLALRKMQQLHQFWHRLMQSLACFEAKSINEKCVYSNVDETNGVIVSQALYWTHNFGCQDRSWLHENAVTLSVLA